MSSSDGGETETWEVEAHAVPILRRLGINRDTLKVGDSVTIRGPRSRRPEKLLLFGAQIETGGGQQFEMLDSIRRAPENRISDTREGIEGVDRLTGTWMTFISGQRVAESPMPLNQAGIEARKNFDPLVNPASDCVPPNLPSLLMIPVHLRNHQLQKYDHDLPRIRTPLPAGKTRFERNRM